VQIDVLTNLALPGIEVDAVTSWEKIQPSLVEVAFARGALPLNRGDLAATWPDLFPTAAIAEHELRSFQENLRETPIEEYLSIGVLRRFPSTATYRKTGARGPAGRLLYDPRRVAPVAWLAERLGPVTILSAGEPLSTEGGGEADADAATPAAPKPAPIAASAVRLCSWFVDTSGDVFRRCGEPITDGRDWCPAHRQRATAVLSTDWLPPIAGVANSNSELDWASVLDTAATDMPQGPIPYSRVPFNDIFVCVGLGPPEEVDWGVEDVAAVPAWVGIAQAG
jgi:hypothetical protein